MAFHPASGPAYPGVINPDGTYSFSDVPLGNVKVTITTEGVGATQPSMDEMMQRAGVKPPEGMQGTGPPVPEGMKAVKVDIPAKYAKVDTTPLTYQVTEGSQTKNFELTD
jgi:hypothetical protein